ncbi:MAG: argininosuccinate lyase [Lentisphaeria bacterium]|jgi:argininosuccinate lyase
MAMWGGRFAKETDALVRTFTESISYDRRLYPHDIRGSQAHARMLAKQGIIPAADAEAIIRELDSIKARIDTGDFEFKAELEDIHMNIEAQLIAWLGPAGARVHTGRSRNDQVATDERLCLRAEADELTAFLRSLQRALVTLAAAHPELVMPGFTHLQHAQPVLFAHHLLAYVEMFDRDAGRLADCRRRLNFLPLGAGAIAGSTLPLDREFVARELEFTGLLRNSMDAVADRDYSVEFLAALAIIAMHTSRLAEDVVLWCSQEFAFLDLDDAFCTGSSLMPQKKNPDVAELTRGKTGRVYGHLLALLTTLKGLPLTYNRDLQEDKEGLFDAIDTVKLILATLAPMFASAKPNARRMAEMAADPALMATDLAEWLVRQGVPFREAHHQVGRFVAACRDRNLPLDQAPLELIQESMPLATAECLKLFDPARSVAARDLTGGTAPAQVRRQLDFWQRELAG